MWTTVSPLGRSSGGYAHVICQACAGGCERWRRMRPHCAADVPRPSRAADAQGNGGGGPCAQVPDPRVPGGAAVHGPGGHGRQGAAPHRTQVGRPRVLQSHWPPQLCGPLSLPQDIRIVGASYQSRARNLGCSVSYVHCDFCNGVSCGTAYIGVAEPEIPSASSSPPNVVTRLPNIRRCNRILDGLHALPCEWTDESWFTIGDGRPLQL